MKKYLWIIMLIFPQLIIAQANRDLVRIERKVNTNASTIQSQEDSLRKVNDQLLNQFLELENIKTELDQSKEDLKKDIDSIKDELGIVEEKSVSTKSELDRFWILISAALVFLMQAGFKVLEMGMVRSIHGTGIGLKNLIDFVVVAVIYFAVGFSFMFGGSGNGFIGTGLYVPTAFELEALFDSGKGLFGMEFFIFQLAFAATAATIVSGAMSERTALIPYLLVAAFVSGFIYPIVGHMIWGNIFLSDGKAFLADLGFLDFAGATVVHSTGAWVAIIGVWILGPRIGRFKLDGSVNNEKFRPSSLGYSVLGVFLLWFGWWGFNGGSNLSIDSNVSAIINNTNLSAAAAALVALLHAYYSDKSNITLKLIGGVLGGLVAITACAGFVDSISALAIGAVAGLLHNWGFDLLIKFKLDDPVGAIPVHGVCGFWGTIAAGIFGNEDQIRVFMNMDASEEWYRLDQIVTQLLGSGVILVFVCVASFIFFKIIDVIIGLRVDPQKENSGYIFISPQKK